MKKKETVFDDYFNNGNFELARKGTMVSMRNLMTMDEHNEVNKKWASEYNGKVEEIKKLVLQIREEVSQCNPLNLMRFVHSMFLMASMNKVSEIEYDMPGIFAMRSIEYIQSIIVSTAVDYDKSTDNEARYHLIMKLAEDIYESVYQFFFYWGAYANETLGYDDETVKYIVEATMSGLIRGNRYQFQHKRLLEGLLIEQNDLFDEVLKLSVSEFFDGIAKLEYSLSSANADSMNGLMNMMDQLANFMSGNPSEDELESFMSDNRGQGEKIVNNLFGYSLNDIKEVTGWPDYFIQKLTYQVGECVDFFFDKEFAAWPIDVLPVHRKPFIGVNGVSYCFDYYSLFDNIYRVIQKTISELDPSKMVQWAQNQKVASENLVQTMFEKLLPGSEIYGDNYYPKKQSLKDMAENDLIVLYDGIVLLVEVKAGSFTYTSPITDHDAHIKSFKTLIEKADNQCIRTMEYIQKNDVCKFYNHDKSEKFQIEKPKDIFTISVTVDNMNEFQAKAEKLSLINIEQGSISICIDDLDIYVEYFDNPLVFVHYLIQRREAAKSKLLCLNDELDHLGMYIKHNMYTLYFGDGDDQSDLQAYGYRQNLDNYFGMLHDEQLSGLIAYKPEQKKYKYIEQIQNYLLTEECKDSIDLSNFLLDLAFDARQELSDTIFKMYKRQKEIRRMLSMSSFGEVAYNIYVFQPGIQLMPNETMLDYVKSSVVKHQEKKRLMLSVYLNDKADVERVEFEFYSYEDIPKDELDHLQEKAIEYTKSRAKGIIQAKGLKKIGRNDPCPCGSGKKYKKCCLGKI